MNFSVELQIPPGQAKIGISWVRNPEGDSGILIDTDCYDEGSWDPSASDLMSRAEKLHEYTGLVFQACITDKLHTALLR
jgi:uncharacterized protein (TIGR04255 family)